MLRLALHIGTRTLLWVAVSLLGAGLLFFASQGNKIVQVVSGADATFGELAGLLALLAVPVLGWALTPAFTVAVFAVFGAMAERGEQVCLDAAGVAPSKTMFGPGVLAIVLAALSFATWLDLAPRAQGVALDVAFHLAGRGLAKGVEEGRFYSPAKGFSLYVARKDGDVLRGIAAQMQYGESSAVLTAKSARIEFDGESSKLVLNAHHGQVFSSGAAFGMMSFESLRLDIDAGEKLESSLGFLPRRMGLPTSSLLEEPPPGTDSVRWRFSFWRRVAGGVGFLCIAGVSLLLGAASRWRRRGFALLTAAAVFLGFHILARLCETLMDGGIIGPICAALLPSLVVVLGGAAAFFLRRPFGPC